MSALTEYKKLEKEMLELEKDGDVVTADVVRDAMDEVWARMTLAERARFEDRDL